METSIAAQIASKRFLDNEAREILMSMANTKKFPSLQHLTAMCIWEHREQFDHPNSQVNIFDNIPNSLKSLLFDEFTPLTNEGGDPFQGEAARIILSLLKRLLNVEMTKFMWPPKMLHPSSKAAAIELWKDFLLLECTNLQIVDFTNKVSKRAFAEQACSFEQALALKMQPHLQVVKLHGRVRIDDSILCAMAKGMPSLRVLDVGEFDARVSTKCFKALSSLHHLDELHFDFHSQDDDINKKVFLLCFRHLPKLRVAGVRFIPNEDFKWHSLACYTMQSLRKLIVSKQKTLGLQEISIIAGSIPAGISLPNLTALNVVRVRSDNYFQWDDPRLSRVSELSLVYLDTYACNQILSQLGKQLKKLVLYHDNCNISLRIDQILDLCPNLEWFKYANNLMQLFLHAPIKPHTLRQLTVLDLSAMLQFKKKIFQGGNFGESMAIPEVLLQLLQAPELRRLEISWLPLIQNEFDEIVSRLQRGEILQKLELAMIEPLHTEGAFFNVETEQVNCLLNSMVLNCPNLNGVFDHFPADGDWRDGTC